MLAKVIYAQPWGNPNKFEEFEYHAESEKEAAALDEVFRQFNHVDGTEFVAKLPIRSFSVGDSVFFPDSGNRFLCEPIGWKKI